MLRINLIMFLFLNHYSAMSLIGNTGTNILKNYENYFPFHFSSYIYIRYIIYNIFRDACKRKVLPGIVKKPQGFTSLQLLTTARNARKNQRFSNLLEIVDGAIIQTTPMKTVQAENPIWIKFRLLIFAFIRGMLAPFDGL